MTTPPNDYSFKNTTSTPVVVIVEPWAEEFTVPPGSTLSIAVTSTRPGLLHTELSPDYFVVWLWATCTVAVFLDDRDQTRRFLSPPVPG